MIAYRSTICFRAVNQINLSQFYYKKSQTIYKANTKSDRIHIHLTLTLYIIKLHLPSEHRH